MARVPSEVYGHGIKDNSQAAQDARRESWCPFKKEKCDKQSRLIQRPFGVCSVEYDAEVIALCPDRFLEREMVFVQVADHCFGSRDNLLRFEETTIEGIGRSDYVIVKHKELSAEVLDFAIVEFQGGETTGTGELVKAFNDFLAGVDVGNRSYRFGLNLADIWKRTFTQILLKGLVMESWGKKIYWVVQEPVYANFLNRYNLHEMTYGPKHNTVFMIQDLKANGPGYGLGATRVESSSVDELFAAFRKNPVIPPLDEFMDTLREKVKARLGAKGQLRLGLRR